MSKKSEKNKREQRTEEELRKASDWLIYEYWMLKGLCELLLSYPHPGVDIEIGLLRNAVLDSFLIHARALVDFFFIDKSQHPDDVVVTDYFTKDEEKKKSWRKQHSKDPEWFKEARCRINKGIAHISYNRYKKPWGCSLIEENISNVFEEFVQLVPPNLLGKRWEKIKSRLKAGDASPVELPLYLEKGGILKSSFYPEPYPDYYPDEKEYD